jgi:hypothetical protein
MSDVFPKWTNQLPWKILAGLALTGTAVVAGMWYYLTPKYTRVGYQPLQPVAFSHATHVEQLGMDCRYCHHAVEQSWYANLPAASTCLRCHNQVQAGDSRLALVRDSAQTGQSIPWVQVHKTPDYVYFNHAVHVRLVCLCWTGLGGHRMSPSGRDDSAFFQNAGALCAWRAAILCHRHARARLSHTFAG